GSANRSGVFREFRGMIGRARAARRLVETIRCRRFGCCRKGRCRKSGGVVLSPSFEKPVAENAIEPTGEFAATIKTRDGLPRCDQRLLRQVLRPVAILAKGERRAPQARS